MASRKDSGESVRSEGDKEGREREKRIEARASKSVQKMPSKKGKKRISLCFDAVIEGKSEEENEGWRYKRKYLRKEEK
ncbi:hypothetical protein ccbrp13_30720 [Ktedonobacteria bacterium brp13]|nr:hypothetical protein ccbrp13_30720 [Ktedonobacteria bacterium brp13]